MNIYKGGVTLQGSVSIRNVIEEKGFVATTTSGMSMYPMLRHQRDCIVVKKADRPLEKFDVALYMSGDRYVLHRVISVKSDVYVIRGDNCTEKEYIKKEFVLGILDSFTRNGKTYDCKSDKAYRLYCRFWSFTAPVRIAFIKARLWLYNLLKGKNK